MVLEFMENNLYEYLNRNHNYLLWEKKLQILFYIIKGLYNIHKQGLVHKDFHTGNILIQRSDIYFGDYDTYISDMGLSGPMIHDQDSKKKEIYEVMPYLSPEVLRGKPYTQAADIYSLGMIIYVFATGHQPFDDVPHDFSLSLDICRNVRPKIDKAIIPDFLFEIMQQCWDQDPFKRPTSMQLYDLFSSWMAGGDTYFSFHVKDDEILKKLKNLDEYLSKQNAIIGNKVQRITHPQAIYTSRLLTPFTQTMISSCSNNDNLYTGEIIDTLSSSNNDDNVNS